MPPRPITATVAPGQTFAVWIAAPTPVETPQPSRHARSSGMPAGQRDRLRGVHDGPGGERPAREHAGERRAVASPVEPGRLGPGVGAAPRYAADTGPARSRTAPPRTGRPGRRVARGPRPRRPVRRCPHPRDRAASGTAGPSSRCPAPRGRCDRRRSRRSAPGPRRPAGSSTSIGSTTIGPPASSTIGSYRCGRHVALPSRWRVSLYSPRGRWDPTRHRRRPLRRLRRGAGDDGERRLRLVHAGRRERDRRPVRGAVRGERLGGRAPAASGGRRRPVAARRPRRSAGSAVPAGRTCCSSVTWTPSSIEGTVAERPFRVDGDIARGPGVSDMKGGLLTGFVATEVLAGGRLRCVRDPHVRLQSRRGDRLAVLRTDHPRAGAAARRGVRAGGRPRERRHRVVAQGDHRLHASRSPGGRRTRGSSPRRAGTRCSRRHTSIVALQGLNGRWPGVTVNVGVVHGGTRTNVVAERCELHVDLRSPVLETLQEAEAEIERICAGHVVPDVTTEVVGHGWHRPMEKKEGAARLVEIAVERCRRARASSCAMPRRAAPRTRTPPRRPGPRRSTGWARSGETITRRRSGSTSPASFRVWRSWPRSSPASDRPARG